jgi:hypothetical protein
MANMLKHDDSCSFIGVVIGYILAGYGARHPPVHFQLSFTWLSELLQENRLLGFMWMVVFGNPEREFLKFIPASFVTILPVSCTHGPYSILLYRRIGIETIGNYRTPLVRQWILFSASRLNPKLITYIVFGIHFI